MSDISRRLARVTALGSALALSGLATGGLALAEGAGDTADAQGFGPDPTGGRTVQPLKNQCTTGEPQDLCRNIGVTDGWFQGKTIKFLYTQNFFCDPAIASGAPSKCEAGAKYQNVPPGTTSAKFTDPLYIPVPLFKPAPKALQCPANVPCVDHPTTIDLSRLAAALKMPASALKNTELPGHDHIITDRNNNRPEWWPVYVVAVTDPGSFAKIQEGKSFDTVKKLAANPNSGVSQPIPTNTFLWFQTLPGTNGSTPAPSGAVAAGGGGTQSLPSAGLVTAAAALTVGSVGAVAMSRRRNATVRT
ncbi:MULTISPECIES: hypothetical protein [Streptomyces]|uniref:LPXTG cell wall anchor domain-containing protein n=1 Tax=Streptomyces doudnae TaxID=3075536 RepID=A0ABD5EZL6_9ACTN|nr:MULTISPECIES: hypothetical protein [unclassified Streptomyces]MDT0439740.1 hypothetical protein [Streptomyces sp. DSM 41981]MYQ69323.1 hypothetical protein [Streptomyces sp. SID4950]SCE52907.1 hypothetical protein GA0115242_14761 [Streptomyces sp. SolWspMP-5a-2]